MAAGPQQRFPSRIVRVNFPTGGYLVVRVDAGNNSQTTVPPTPAISVDVGGKDKVRATLLDKNELTNDIDGTPLKIYLVWSDVLPTKPTGDTMSVKVADGGLGPIAYGSQFAQENLIGTVNFHVVKHDEYSAYKWTGSIDPKTGKPIEPGEFIYDPPVQYRNTWYEDVGAKTPFYSGHYPAIDNPHNAYYIYGITGFSDEDTAQAFCDEFKRFWNAYNSALTYATNWTKVFNLDGSAVEINQSPIDLYPLTISLPAAKSRGFTGLYLFKIPSALQDQLEISVDSINSKGFGSISALGYSDVKFPFDTTKRKPTLADFDISLLTHSITGNPKVIPPDSVLPPDEDMPFDVNTDDSTYGVGHTWTVRTKIVPTHNKNKPHYVAIDVGKSGSSPPTIG